MSSPRRPRSSTRSRSFAPTSRIASRGWPGWSRRVNQVELELPEHLLNSELDGRRKQITEQLAQAGLTVEQYLADIAENQTEEEFWADLEARGAQALKAQIILDKVAEEHSLDADQNDFTQHLLRKAQSEGTSPQQVADHLKEHPHHIEEYVQEIRRAKALAMIVESATVTESNGTVVELAKLQEDGTYADSEPQSSDVEGEVAEESTDEQTQAPGA
jgi:trigger factor